MRRNARRCDTMRCDVIRYDAMPCDGMRCDTCVSRYGVMPTSVPVQCLLPSKFTAVCPWSAGAPASAAAASDWLTAGSLMSSLLVCQGGARLHFGAVDWQAAVYINGIHVGSHSGGWPPPSPPTHIYLNRHPAISISHSHSHPQPHAHPS